MSSPHLAMASSVSVIMGKVMLALIPAIAAYVYVFGPAILATLALASLTALVSEAIMLKLRGVPVQPFLMDGSALVTGWLLALSVPPLAPWWLVVIGTAFAIMVAKQLYGGLGNNIFNPAMVGYAVLIVSFPVPMTQWLAPETLAAQHLDLGQQLAYMLLGSLPEGIRLDALTMASPLDTLKSQLQLQHTVREALALPIFGSVGGKGTELVAAAYLAGGAYLLQQRVITWHVPAAFLGGLVAISALFYGADADRYAAPWFHLASGASLIGAFFILTDPVTGPTTPKGKLLFGAGAGLLTYLIRAFGGYPDGVAFACLLMNLCVPLIDMYTQPPVFGKKGG
ncbi:MAG: RnfABCDGE type electron transport complex subunit D [Betaproteobacteria bacterium]|nr:RnfABCDGE type electron transport complex subunit D [Betaproteobacteria bacterium]